MRPTGIASYLMLEGGSGGLCPMLSFCMRLINISESLVVLRLRIRRGLERESVCISSSLMIFLM